MFYYSLLQCFNRLILYPVTPSRGTGHYLAVVGPASFPRQDNDRDLAKSDQVPWGSDPIFRFLSLAWLYSAICTAVRSLVVFC